MERGDKGPCSWAGGFGGKTLRKAGSSLHIVLAWCAANRVVLGAVHTEQKGKKPSIDKLLDLLVPKEGDVVTIDAIGCQQQIVSKIVKQKADYVIALKGNQGHLYSEVKNYFSQAVKAPIEAHCEALAVLKCVYQKIDKRLADLIKEERKERDYTFTWFSQRPGYEEVSRQIELEIKNSLSGDIPIKFTTYLSVLKFLDSK